MKKNRIIIGIIFAVLAIALNVFVVIEWHKQLCDIKSLVLAVIFYTSCLTAFWYVLDSAVRESY